MTSPTPAPTPPVVPGSDPTPTPAPAPPANPAPAPSGFTPISSQEDLDRIIGARLSREREKFADYEALRAKAGELDQLREQQMSETERAVQQARREAEAAARADEQSKYADRDRARALGTVEVYFDAATRSGRLDAERHGPILAALDRGKFVAEDGSVDADAIERTLSALAAASTAPAAEPAAPAALSGFNRATPMWPAMGQGRSETPPTPDVAPGMARLRQAFTPTQ